MPDRAVLIVKASWDEDARVWVAVSDDVPGLVAEADNMEALITELRTLIPELLQENGMQPDSDNCNVPFQVLSQRTEIVNACM